MRNRLTAIREIDVNVVGQSSILLVGDGGEARLENKGIALIFADAQASGATERNFSDYPIFRRTPPPPRGRTEDVLFSRRNEIPLISVKKVRVVGASSSSLIQAGSIGSIESISRLHFIRQISAEALGEEAL
ncbi:spore germination protein GerPE [Thermicanus aegyptius]|uniref:spore germination protein GerPE n=1 Tax=Thermicanus aegyptius TaxID=94009 RepID=UPI000426AEEE|nr:spore germination protein GerPE [Thermicanus aegyptius]